MKYQVVVFKSGRDPFIHEVLADRGSFDIEDKAKMVHETFEISRIDLSLEPGISKATYLVANKSRIGRDEVEAAVKLLGPAPVITHLIKSVPKLT